MIQIIKDIVKNMLNFGYGKKVEVFMIKLKSLDVIFSRI